MAVKITELPEITQGYDLNDLLLIYDKVQERTSTIKATAFKGRSVFSSSIPPDPDSHINGTSDAYVNGDVYFHEAGAMVDVYRYKANTNEFLLITNLRLPTRYTQDHLPQGEVLSTVKAALTYKNDSAWLVGDTLYDEGEGVTWGPYDSEGFSFKLPDRKYTVERNSIEVTGTDEPDRFTIARPRSGDKYTRTVGPLVFQYSYDVDRELDTTWDVRVVEGWGLPVLLTKASLKHGILDPVVDDELYVDGEFYISLQGNDVTLFGPYVTGGASGSWGMGVRLRASKVLQLEDTNYPINVNDFTQCRLIVGDMFNGKYSGGREEGITIISIDHDTGVIVYSEPYKLTKGNDTHTADSNGRPMLDNDKYWVADFVRTPDTTMYGPYNPEGTTPEEIWPTASAPLTSLVLQDVTNTTTNYKLVVDNGVPYLEEV